MKMDTQEKLRRQWIREGKFFHHGLTYKQGINDVSAMSILTAGSLKMSGSICFICDLTLTGSDLDCAIHEGFTIGNGETMYWMMIWHTSGHVTVYNKSNPGVRRWLNGDREITVHFKK